MGNLARLNIRDELLPRWTLKVAAAPAVVGIVPTVGVASLPVSYTHLDVYKRQGNPTLPLQKHGVRPRCPFFDAPRF